jgi:hypothetical protein
MFAGLAVGFKRTAVFVIDGLESRAMAPWLRGGLQWCVNARTSRYRRMAPTVLPVGASQACARRPGSGVLRPFGIGLPSKNFFEAAHHRV